MIKFFRKIRQKLLTENKLSKYLLYAIGEIVLVIIGILIALQINNNNEARKTEAKIVTILKEVQKDLGLDIQKSDDLIAYYKEKDSIINLVETNELTYEDYKNDNNRDLRHLIYNAFHMKIHTNGYDNLMKNIDNIPEHLKEVIEPLNEIYVYHKYEIDKFDHRIDVITDRQIDNLGKTKDWYYALDSPNLTDDMIDYFLNDSYYKNAADLYQNAGWDNLALGHVIPFRANAVKVYKQIHELIKSTDSLPNYIPHFKPTGEQLQDYVGTYQLEKIENFDGQVPEVKVIVSIKNNELVSVNTNNPENLVPIHFTSLDYATIRNDAYNNIKYIRGNNNKVIEVISTYRFIKAYFKKIE